MLGTGDTKKEKKGGRGGEKETCWSPSNIGREAKVVLEGSSPRATAPERLRAALSCPKVSYKSSSEDRSRGERVPGTVGRALG